MKTVRIKRFCRLPIIIIIVLAIVMPILLFFLIVGIQKRSTELILIGVIPFLCYLTGLVFFFCYGIKITPKKISIVFYNTVKTFRLENVDYIKIEFNNNSIWVEVKPLRQKPYVFEFSHFILNPSSSLSRFLIIKVRVTKRLADKIITELSQCEKISIKSHFEN